MGYRVRMGIWNNLTFVEIMRPSQCGKNLLMIDYPEEVVIIRHRERNDRDIDENGRKVKK